MKGCQTLAMDPTSLPQQSLVNTVPHAIMVHWYLLGSGREFQDMTKIWPNFLPTHHWCLASIPSVYVACKGLSETLILDPTSLLQQSLGNTVPCVIMVHWYLLLSGREFQIQLTLNSKSSEQKNIDLWSWRVWSVLSSGLPYLPCAQGLLILKIELTEQLM